ncbi:TlpA disulfide reductase family protein [Paenibacillus sp. NPDC058071]|uniref:TlpA disulfide reductase family protein n=1 Tax=Paenibacillus sp. NPDC058071 TaxID=3346326 RepID=UPI0036DC6456
MTTMRRNLITILVLLALVTWGIYEAVIEKEGRQLPQSVDDGQQIGLAQGNVAPDFELKTLDGEVVKLSDFRGKRVIVNMWATWCPPCRAEMPDMQKFYDTYKDDRVAVLAVNMTESEKSVGQVPSFLDEYGITFPVILDEKSEVANLYQVRSLPTSYMIDSDGVIQQKIIGPMNNEMMTKMVLKMR